VHDTIYRHKQVTYFIYVGIKQLNTETKGTKTDIKIKLNTHDFPSVSLLTQVMTHLFPALDQRYLLENDYQLLR